MTVASPTTDRGILAVSALIEYGLNQEDIARLREAIQAPGDPVTLLTLLPTGDLESSSEYPARIAFFPDSLNRVPDLNQLYKNAFGKIQQNGFLICRLETAEQRKKRLLHEGPVGIAHLRYAGDYLLHRVAPRVFPTRQIYQKLFPCRRILSKAEALGRLYHAGYSVKQAFESAGSLIIVAQKSAAEYIERPLASEGVLLRMWRIGRFQKPFCVYKLRTMHPYSEYLQDYLMETSGLETGGKFKDDFRITTLGKWMRKYWIDELPMLVNVLKGEMKMVGVRPLSNQYFKLYPRDVQHERCQAKPGLFPPYYADMPKTFTEIVESERRYLQAYKRSPLKTDFSYLLKITYNIIWKRVSSK